MKEAHKLGRVLALRAALNGKCTAYLDSKLQVKQSHNFTGDFIEKMVYSKETKKVTIYDKDGEEIKQPKAEPKKATKKDTPSQKLSNASDEKSS
jgi:hypothetical protein